jgi:thiaminase
LFLEAFLNSCPLSISKAFSAENYQTVLTHLRTFNLKGKNALGSLANKLAIDFKPDYLEQFYQYLSGKLAPVTLNQNDQQKQQKQQIKKWVKQNPKNLKQVIEKIREEWGVITSKDKDTVKRVLM